MYKVVSNILIYSILHRLTTEDRFYTKLMLYANNKRYRANSDAQQLIKKVYNNYKELETYAIFKDTYELVKGETRLQYSEFHITKNVSRDVL